MAEGACRVQAAMLSTASAQFSAVEKGWRSAPDAILLGHRRAHSRVPARTPTVHQRPHSVKAVGGPTCRSISSDSSTQKQNIVRHIQVYFILLLGGGASVRLLRVVLPSSALFGWRRHCLC